jgi:chemotaxis response regulator CheB
MREIQDPESPGGRGRGLRVVIVDRDPTLRQFYRSAYHRLGHQVVGEARSRRKAVELCRTLRPDLVLTLGHLSHFGMATTADGRS